MERSFTRSMRAAWIARWQEVAPRLRFWLLLAGYDLRDRSRADLFYLPYLILFWSAWAFAMFTALSTVVAGLLEALNPGMTELAAVQVLFWALLGWLLLSLYQGTRRSPLVFSAADAALLCQTPVDRAAVVLVWFLTEWPRLVLPFAAGALALGFALFEVSHVIETVDPATAFGYTVHGLRALSIVLPLHFLILALVWTAGTWRLHGGRERPLLRWLPLVAALVVAPILFSGWQQAPAANWWRTLAWPLLAAFGWPPWSTALLIAVIAALAALALLLATARDLNLSRAAQETSHIHSERYLTQVGGQEAARQLSRVRRLGQESQATRLPIGAGLWATVWKDVTRAGRGWREGLLSWAGILGLSIAILVAPEWPSRLVAIVFWVQLVANRTTAPLGDNLVHWWLWRQQPFPAWELVGLSLAPPIALLLLLSAAVWLISSWLPLSPGASLAPLLPLLGMQVTLTAAWDLLGEIQPTGLLAGRAPAVSVTGLFLSLFLAGVPLGAVWLVVPLTDLWWIGILVGALLSVLLSALLSTMVARRAHRFA